MKAERVLIAPLHWGLGHAARCIPIIEKEMQAGSVVFISANGGPRALLENRFPNATFIDIPFMEITYPADGNMVRHFAKNGLKLLRSIWKEHQILKRIIRENSLTKVISDSRFGLWNKQLKSIFISHQIEIQTPVFQRIVNALNRWVMNRYDEVWIPDFEEFPGLAGKLSHPKVLPNHCNYIGPLSRFSGTVVSSNDDAVDALAIISGPEPQRMLFEAELTRQFIESGEKALILKGKPNQKEELSFDYITVKNHLDDPEFAQAVNSAKAIFARSGYSTIMDLHALDALHKAVFTPTPGQTEQEYLAELHQNK